MRLKALVVTRDGLKGVMFPQELAQKLDVSDFPNLMRLVSWINSMPVTNAGMYCVVQLHEFVVKIFHLKTFLRNSKYNLKPTVSSVWIVDVERDFSKMRLTKTRLRSSMKNRTLNVLLKIAIDGPARKDFPFDKAILHFLKMKERR